VNSEYILDKTRTSQARLLIFKHRRHNISVSVALISAVTGPKVTFADRTCFCPQDTRDHATVNTRLHCSNSPDSQRSCPTTRHAKAAAGLMTFPAEVKPDRRVKTIQPDDHLIINEAVTQRHLHLQACT